MFGGVFTLACRKRESATRSIFLEPWWVQQLLANPVGKRDHRISACTSTQPQTSARTTKVRSQKWLQGQSILISDTTHRSANVQHSSQQQSWPRNVPPRGLAMPKTLTNTSSLRTAFSMIAVTTSRDLTTTPDSGTLTTDAAMKSRRRHDHDQHRSFSQTW